MGAGIIAASAISVGGSLYSGAKQREAQKDAQKEQDRLAREAAANEQLILAENARVAGEGDANIKFGIDDGNEPIGSYDDFLAPTQSTSKTTGLGTSGQTSSLGFGV